MANMSYCRFQNTSMDLRDCTDVMQEACDLDELRLSTEELRAMKRMRDLCTQFLEESERLLETHTDTCED